MYACFNEAITRLMLSQGFMDWRPVSAKTGSGVDDVMVQMAEVLLKSLVQPVAVVSPSDSWVYIVSAPTGCNEIVLTCCI